MDKYSYGQKLTRFLVAVIFITAAFAIGYAMAPRTEKEKIVERVSVVEAKSEPKAAAVSSLDAAKNAQNMAAWKLLNATPDLLQRCFIMEKNVAWQMYMEDTSETDVPKAGEIAVKRTLNRARAMSLDPEQFELYELIGNGAYLQLKSGIYPLTFGELCITEEDNHFSFPARIVPESCIRLEKTLVDCSAAILEWQTLGSDEKKKYLLCLWDAFGNPAGMFPIGKSAQAEKMTQFALAVKDEKTLAVRYLSGGDAKEEEYSLEGLREQQRQYDVFTVGVEPMLNANTCGLLLNCDPCYLSLIADSSISAAIRENITEHSSFTVLHLDKQLVSYRMETMGYNGGENNYTNISVGTLLTGHSDKLMLSDIVAPEELNKMTGLLRDAVAQHFRCKDYESARKKLTGDVWPNDNFYFDDKGLHFIYNEAEIAPYPYGPIELCIKWPRP